MKYFKEGQTVYHDIYGKGVVYKVNESGIYPVIIEFEDCKITFTTDGRKNVDEIITLSQNPIPEIVNVPLEEEYVPFTLEDDLLGMQVISKDKFYKGVITYQDRYFVVVGDLRKNYEELLNDYVIWNGKPCGKL